MTILREAAEMVFVFVMLYRCDLRLQSRLGGFLQGRRCPLQM